VEKFDTITMVEKQLITNSEKDMAFTGAVSFLCCINRTKEGGKMTRTINISILNRVAWQTNRVEYICGNSDYVVNFTFDGEWDNIETKTARFVYGQHYTDVVFTGNECNVPIVQNATKMSIGVFAGNLRTTTSATVLCKKSILSESGLPDDPTPDVYAQVMEFLNNGVSAEQIAKAVADYLEANPVETGSTATIGVVELLADKWVGSGNLHSQVVSIAGVTENSQVDITPDVEQLVVFYEKDLTFVTENEGGTVTVYAIGQKPLHDYTIQVTITEVSV
jgi:hypothetical protein